MTELPRQKCPRTNHADCPLCGKWLGWIDLRKPGRSPTPEEWRKCCSEMQQEHDKLRLREFESMRLK